MDFILLFIALLMYFLPTLIAIIRECEYGDVPIAINFILGWTFIGWFVALYLAATDDPM